MLTMMAVPGVTSAFTVLPVVMFPPHRTHLPTYICLTFSQSVLLILYFTLTHFICIDVTRNVD